MEGAVPTEQEINQPKPSKRARTSFTADQLQVNLQHPSADRYTLGKQRILSLPPLASKNKPQTQASPLTLLLNAEWMCYYNNYNNVSLSLIIGQTPFLSFNF